MHTHIHTHMQRAQTYSQTQRNTPHLKCTAHWHRHRPTYGNTYMVMQTHASLQTHQTHTRAQTHTLHLSLSHLSSLPIFCHNTAIYGLFYWILTCNSSTSTMLLYCYPHCGQNHKEMIQMCLSCKCPHFWNEEHVNKYLRFPVVSDMQ